MLLKKHIDILNFHIKTLYFDLLTPSIVKKITIRDLVITFIKLVISDKVLKKIKLMIKNIIDNIKPWIKPCLFIFKPMINDIIAIKI